MDETQVEHVDGQSERLNQIEGEITEPKPVQTYPGEEGAGYPPDGQDERHSPRLRLGRVPLKQEVHVVFEIQLAQKVGQPKQE